MKIKTILSQNRRDFTAVMVCESCAAEENNKYGYDDAHYHHNVIPAMKCKNCGESAPDTYRALTTKYDEGTQV